MTKQPELHVSQTPIFDALVRERAAADEEGRALVDRILERKAKRDNRDRVLAEARAEAIIRQQVRDSSGRTWLRGISTLLAGVFLP